MDLHDIYTQTIIENSNSKKHRHALPGANKVLRGVNPSCGDDIELALLIGDNGLIEDAAYTGDGCAISLASVSIMIDLVKGKTMDEAQKLIDNFLGMIKKEDLSEAELDNLEDAVALENIANMPARVKCATLAWHTLDKALHS